MLINFGAYILSMSWAILGVAISYNNYVNEKSLNK